MARVRYEKHLGCVFSCVGSAIEVWDPVMRADAAESPADSTKGLFAYSPSEAARGFEMGSSASLPYPEDDDGGGGGGNGYGGSRRSLHGANPNKSRDGPPVNVVALDVKYIKVLIYPNLPLDSIDHTSIERRGACASKASRKKNILNTEYVEYALLTSVTYVRQPAPTCSVFIRHASLFHIEPRSCRSAWDVCSPLRPCQAWMGVCAGEFSHFLRCRRATC